MILTPILIHLVVSTATVATSPAVLVSGLELEQLVTEPSIVTPIGIDFDNRGRMLVVESHTHQRQDNYTGPSTDRIRMFEDSNGDGHFDRESTFADGFVYAMNVVVGPDDAVYVVTRSDVHLLRDNDGDGKADLDKKIIRLETEATYPHNGLSGIAIVPDLNHLYLGLGENFGMPFQIIGTDGQSLSGTGGAGKIFRFNLAGAEAEQIATGLWNPFSICYDRGSLFTVDNDPHARPPCRLLHVRAGGDYGFRWEYNSSGMHPLQAWNGELPGTLPMMCGTGEAPCAVVPHRDALWVTSWGDYRISRYDLHLAGPSYQAHREIVVQGGPDFRPTGMVLGPDGNLYFTDWVDRSYPVHSKGRIWRLSFTHPAGKTGAPSPPAQDIQTTAAWKTAQNKHLSSVNWQQFKDPAQRLQHLQARQWQGVDHPVPLLKTALQDPDPEIRLLAVRWISDQRIVELRQHVFDLLDQPQISGRDYLCLLGAVDWLAREPKPRETHIAEELLIAELQNTQRPDHARALALRLLNPNHPEVSPQKLTTLIGSQHAGLRREAVRTLSQQSSPDRFDVLIQVATDDGQDSTLRADALVGLSADAGAHQGLLADLANGADPLLAHEARRILRLSGLVQQPSENKPPADNQGTWRQLLATPGDAESGRRLFFSRVGANCSICHQHQGRGGTIGPDLTYLAKRFSKEQIITSILLPNQEIAPHYQPQVLVTQQGKQVVGLRIAQGGDSGKERYYDAEGKIVELSSADIETRRTSATSLMPSGLEKTITVADMRDLVTFLSTAP